MFYSETILSRRGPLGKVWLAAHMERKLSKSQTLQTDIEQSVDAIMGQDIEIMALRLSGQLLLGVVRIYSRKAKYLLDDCNDALLKIKMAFRPGVVDLTEDQLNVNKTAITLQATNLDLDLLLPDVNWDMDFEERPARAQGHHQANVADITLPQANNLDNLNPLDPFDIGPADGIGSQDFLDVDLGIDWGEGSQAADEQDRHASMSVDGSVGVGRDAASHHDSLDFQHLNGEIGDFGMDVRSNRSVSRDLSEQPLAPNDMDFPDFGGMDLGDLGIGFDKPADLDEPPVRTQPSSRASSPLSEAPDTPMHIDIELPADNQADQGAEPKLPPKKAKEKKQIIDSVTELQGGPGAIVGRKRGGAADNAPMKDVSNIVTDQHFLPRSSLAMRLLEIRDDPLSHFLPTKSVNNTSFFCAAPPGLIPELADLFMRPIGSSNLKRRHASPAENSHKRIRLDDEEEVEQGRRVMSPTHSLAGQSDRFGGQLDNAPAFDFGDQTAPFDDYQLEIPAGDVGTGLDAPRGRSVSTVPTARSRLSTPGVDGMLLEEGDETFADLSCPLAIFDMRRAQQSQTQENEAEQDVQERGPEEKGYSKNTVKALTLIRKELQPSEGEEDIEKSLSFRTMADKGSRRAASSFFFELLVLGTRDCVQLTQPAPFENIEIRGKPKLWEQQRHASVVVS